jgi:hypothetical protein
VELKISIEPSTLNRGLVLSKPGALNRCGSPPPGAVAATQISFMRVFFASMTFVTCTATYLPSGLITGALSVLTLYQSPGVNARLVAGAWPSVGITAAETSIASSRLRSPDERKRAVGCIEIPLLKNGK